MVLLPVKKTYQRAIQDACCAYGEDCGWAAVLFEEKNRGEVTAWKARFLVERILCYLRNML